MELSELERNIITLSIEQWNKSFGGISSLDLSEKIGFSNEEIMEAIEVLVTKKIGSMNANAEFFIIKMDVNNPKFDIDSEPTIAHVFFPSKEFLEDHFYSSKLARENFPEYKRRLHLGEHQLGQVFFDEAVLSRYFAYPEYYEVDDSRSGGHIYIRSDETPEEKYINVKHGKRALSTGKSVVVAIYKDLSKMSEQEQRHWHAHELDKINLEFLENDKAYSNFVDRNYFGAWVNYENDLTNLKNKFIKFNNLFAIPIFNRIENDYCRPPTENTNKAFFDSCSELFKLVGPDNINQQALKNYLEQNKKCQSTDFIHTSGRPLSALQLIELFEEKIEMHRNFSSAIRALQNDRTKADHKITESEINSGNRVEDFFGHCKALANSLEEIISKLNKNLL